MLFCMHELGLEVLFQNEFKCLIMASKHMQEARDSLAMLSFGNVTYCSLSRRVLELMAFQMKGNLHCANCIGMFFLYAVAFIFV